MKVFVYIYLFATVWIVIFWKYKLHIKLKQCFDVNIWFQRAKPLWENWYEHLLEVILLECVCDLKLCSVAVKYMTNCVEHLDGGRCFNMDGVKIVVPCQISAPFPCLFVIVDMSSPFFSPLLSPLHESQII